MLGLSRESLEMHSDPTDKLSPQARQALLDEICGQLLSPESALFVEDVLARLPDYDSEELLDLIDAELCRRTDRGESPVFEEFAGRFPQLSMETLAQLFEVHLLESGVRGRETPNFHLPGIVQGMLLSRCDDGEIRRARPESSAEWIAVRVFETASWTDPQRGIARQWLNSVSQWTHSHLLNYRGAIHEDELGNLFAWLPNAEGTPLASRLVKPISPPLAAQYLLPVAGAAELARQQGVWIGDVQVEHLQIDHYNRLRLLGSGGLSSVDVDRNLAAGALDDEATERERQTRLMTAFGELWEKMVVSDQWDLDEAVEPEIATARRMAAAMSRACQQSSYECFADFVFDLDLMRQLDSGNCRRLNWKCDMPAKSRWLPWR